MTPIKLEAHIPDEPPAGSVVIDQNGDAWQRMKPGLFSFIFANGAAVWVRARNEAGGIRSTWAMLLGDGPVSLVHRGEEPAERAAVAE